MQCSIDGHGVQRQRSPGKHTLTEGLAADGRATATAEAAPGLAVPGRAAPGAANTTADTLPRSAAPASFVPVQRVFGLPPGATAASAEDPARAHAAAARGAATPATKLPYVDRIQRAFGRHDISGIQAHVGADAAASARDMGAQAYAMGDHVVLGDGADLHTVAHEAAHVVQQRGGVQLAGGVGKVGDRHEQHADEVAGLVVQGKSAEASLDAYAPGSGTHGQDPGAALHGSGAVQRKWSRMSTVFDAGDDAAVARIANLAGQGNHVAAFREVLTSIGGSGELLARFNAAVTAYTNAGRLPIVTAALQTTFAAPGKAYAAWEVLDEVDGGAPDRLQRMFAARNVIVAGETHGDVEARAMEGTLLPAHHIQVRYENQGIQSSGGNVTPDPPAYRLLYMLEDFYEQLLARKANHGDTQARADYLGQMDAAYNRYQGEFNNYAQGAIEASADYQGETLISYARLNELRTVLYQTLELIEARPDDAAVYNAPLIANNAPDLLDKFDHLKEVSGHADNAPVMRKLRSDRMLAALQTDLAGAAKTVYKVGNNHIADIRARAGNVAWVLDEAQYKALFRL
ncbi:MAG TPA: DUF4157 domain-containing protein [Kofleriaceae bacterium]